MSKRGDTVGFLAGVNWAADSMPVDNDDAGGAATARSFGGQSENAILFMTSSSANAKVKDDTRWPHLSPTTSNWNGRAITRLVSFLGAFSIRNVCYRIAGYAGRGSRLSRNSSRI